jgi:2-dehydropantoate 2-reductase
MPRILVVGGGAIGGITAAQMPRNVVVLDANAEHVARLRNPGLVYEQEGVEHTVRLSAVTSIDELDGDFDFALIAVKSPQHREVLEPPACVTAVSLSRAATPCSRSGLRAWRWPMRRT